MASASPPFNLRPRRTGGSSLQLLLPSTRTHLTVTDVCSRPDVCLPSAPPAASTYITRSSAPHLQPVLTLDMNLCLLLNRSYQKHGSFVFLASCRRMRSRRSFAVTDEVTHIPLSERAAASPVAVESPAFACFGSSNVTVSPRLILLMVSSFLHGFDACLQKRFERQDLRLLSAKKDEVAMKLGLKRSQSADWTEE